MCTGLLPGSSIGFSVKNGSNGRAVLFSSWIRRGIRLFCQGHQHGAQEQGHQLEALQGLGRAEVLNMVRRLKIIYVK